ncbi:transketolase family protein [Actinopolyspora halophila]|uniref:transketolase family protein n=1 Tax=Actinopolyspora halophila TaxID=1850 RepID=UPI00039B39A7|nr:transketolase [Actinopolyspora halophila]
MTAPSRTTMRDAFVDTVDEALEHDPRVSVVLADISADRFTAAAERHPDRIVNLGIREQAMLGVAGGMALTGLRPVAHSITPFLVERPFEQIKLDLSHQGVGAVLVSTGASYDYPTAGRTHMAPADVALLDTLPGWTVHVPGHPDEVTALLRSALSGDEPVYVRLSEQENPEPLVRGPGLREVRRGGSGVVVAVGPMLRPTLAATEGLDVTVLYAATVRPFDPARLRAATLAAKPNVVLVEPYLRGTSAHVVDEALPDVAHRVLPLGVRRDRELRAYGNTDEHAATHGIDAAGIATAVRGFLDART